MLAKALDSSQPCRRQRRSGALRGPQASARGFTLIELMTVVSIVGVLATLATFGVRKYLLQAKKAESISMLTQIRGAEEAYRDETFSYLGLTDLSVWHPTSAPDSSKRMWDSASTTAKTTVFDPLGVRANGPVAYSYTVFAGTAGTTLPTIPTTKVFNFPTPTAPFYIAMARADLNGDGTYTYALTHSDSDEIYLDEGF